MNALGERLYRLLMMNPDGAQSVRIISEEPELRARALMALPLLRQEALRPAGKAGVMRVISRRFALFPQPERDESEWAAWWADYVEALQDMTEAKIEAAMAAHIKSPEGEFLPKPGRLRALASEIETKSVAMEALNRVTMLRNREEQAAPPESEKERYKPSQEEMKAIMAEFHAKMAAKCPPPARPQFNPPNGKADETGITPQLREALANKRYF
jgi:hypothetical protein